MEEQCILFMSTFPPRECGIATFCQDLVKAIDERCHPNIKSLILAMNRNGTNTYNYSKKVGFQLNDSDIDQYISLAKKINKINKIKLVNIQHEFGIFGGEYGSYLNAFLEILEKPVVITFHSILPDPDIQLKKTVQSIAKRVNAFIVMSNKGKEILRTIYGLKNDIYVIHHGIPYSPFGSGEKEKKYLGYKDRLILCSFGMINRGKGYEYIIQSLPEVIKQFPNLLYFIIGETHPVVRKNDGEKYRNYLERKVKELGLENHVKFYNKYVKLEEIIMYLRACDVYISSGQNKNQITSGTLAYAQGCGRPVISTPFLHAMEDITPDTGILTKFKDSKSFTQALITLLSKPELRKELGKNAYHLTRNRTWENVAAEYTKVFRTYIYLEERHLEKLPQIRLKHLYKLTDNFGIIQFAKHTTPDPTSGYSVDDVARALVVAAMHYEKTKDSKLLEMIKTYLNFIKYVEEEGKFYNFVDYKKMINKDHWSEDAHGRTIYALGYLTSLKEIPLEIKDEAKELIGRTYGVTQCLRFPRAICFTIGGYHFFNQYNTSETNKQLIIEFANLLVELYQQNSSADWHWFEKSLTYDNSKFPEALFYAYLATSNEQYLSVAKESLDFLISVCFHNGIFVPIGQRGWYNKDGRRAYFDQQPIEASSIVQALIVAYQVTGNKEYFTKAIKAFSWFLGKNMINHALYNPTTGGCYDGLGERTININQGAESTVCYLLARLTLDGKI